MSEDFNFNRIEDETCYFCKASPFVDCAVDCPVNFAQFGQTIPDSLRGVITMELLKQAEWIYESGVFSRVDLDIERKKLLLAKKSELNEVKLNMFDKFLRDL